MTGDGRTTPGSEDDLERLYDRAKVIPPTRTDEPDSIVGGIPTEDFPECCAVGNADGYFCTGTLIAPTVVVTARHCDPVDRVFVGGSDVANASGGETIMVSGQHVHREADLRVLVLQQQAKTGPCHVAQGLEAQGESALLVGFGTIDHDGRQGYGIKRKVEVPITALDCGSAQLMIETGCRAGEMVAGHRGLDRDSCLGDSGGPLYVQGTEGAYYLLAATSRGVRDADQECGDGGIYVRIDRYLDWIREVTGIQIEGSLL
jgi:Trypsin